MTNILSPLNTPNRRAKRQMRKAKWRANNAAHAAINKDFYGEAGSRRAAEYHGKLKALSQGLG